MAVTANERTWAGIRTGARTRARAGTAAAAFLAADALVHVYWMTGSTWPARDPASLSRAVLNMEVPFTPPALLAPLGLLLAGAALLLAQAGRPARLARRLPTRAVRLGAAAVAAGVLARTVVGLAWALGFGVDTASPFYRLNLFVYTPACLALFTAVLIATRRPAGERPVSSR
ncbi:DUF3995 domain-containing protein [Streptomyces sp. NBC_00091]|uniref:DUF3995 domain-containing protein n=1 Tax=Streptomyces sp. NBC_00091 TaxID=2975648 RepID=UPI00224EDAF1|nr:DUF3995 domain-containing protein [Streptomyces sp. NBC_00091]MCX5377368.1 DUF3995 domain-containing protein [Streptomyces sp. NBC_00091]